MKCARCDRLRISSSSQGMPLGAFALYWGLPEQVPPSWAGSGRGTVWLGAPMVVFLLPTAVAITDLLLRGLCIKHPIDEPGSTDALASYDAIMLRFSIFVMGVHGAVLLAILRTAVRSGVGGPDRPPDAGCHDDQHRESSPQDSSQPRDRHSHAPNAFGPTALDQNASIAWDTSWWRVALRLFCRRWRCRAPSDLG